VVIENYLEPYLNYYIVEHESEAYEAINILSDAAKGKAHFFILDSFEKFESTPGRIYDNAFPATEIIEYDPKYKKLMAYILDKVYIYALSLSLSLSLSIPLSPCWRLRQEI
jgi:chromosome segregation protein